MSEPVQYELVTVRDFYKVPAERRAAMFQELEQMMLFTELVGVEVIMDGFDWIDDGQRTTTIKGADGNAMFAMKVTKDDAVPSGESTTP